MVELTAAADRPRWFVIAFVVLTVNGAVTLAAAAINSEGWLIAALGLFGISAIVWVAVAAGTFLLMTAPDDTALCPQDIVLLALAAMVATLPVPAASAAALTGLSLWAIHTAGDGTPLRRAAIIFLSITTSLLWGRLALAMGSGPLLAGEGWLTGTLAGTGGTGNLVEFANGRSFVVAPGCSSLQGVSLAVVLWVTVTQYFAIPLDRRAWLTLAGAVCAAIMSNVARLTAIASFPAHFDTLHAGVGATLFGWAGLAAIVAVIWIGLHGALVARA